MKKAFTISSICFLNTLAACGNNNAANENAEFENEALYTGNEEVNEEAEEEPVELNEEEENNWFHEENDVENENETAAEDQEAESSYEYGVEDYSMDVQLENDSQMTYEYETVENEPTGQIEMTGEEADEIEDTEAINQIEEMLQEMQIYPDSTEEEALEEILNYLELTEEEVTSLEMEMNFTDGEMTEASHG